MSIQYLTNVTVHPYFFRGDIFYGGIDARAESGNGRLFRDDIPADVQVTGLAEESIEGRYLFAGPLWNHFGHVMVDCIHRLWAHSDHDGVVFSGVIGLRGVRTQTDLEGWQVPQFMLDLMEVMGIRPCRIVVVKRPTSFSRLEVPIPGATVRGKLVPFYREHLARYQLRIEEAASGYDAPPRLYYSRLHMLNRGGVIGSSFFERRLKENGFVVTRPESMSIAEQFALILKSKLIVFDEGSAMHLTEPLVRIPPKVYMFPRHRRNSLFRNAVAQRGSFLELAEDQNVGVLGDMNGRESVASLSFYFDPAAIFELMKRLSLVSGGFDLAEYLESEMKDLLSAPVKSAEIQKRRQTVLLANRGAVGAAWGS